MYYPSILGGPGADPNTRPGVFGPGPLYANIRPVSASTTIDDTYAGTVIRSDAAGPITLTFPDTPRLGFNCAVVQAGAGAVTVIAGGGATMNNRQSFTKTAGQWGTIGVLAIAPDTYVLTGDGA